MQRAQADSKQQTVAYIVLNVSRKKIEICVCVCFFPKGMSKKGMKVMSALSWILKIAVDFFIH